ncbi:MAG: hypothetical protein MRY59_07120 [Aquisalinus sp.]|nr:hypothetical protein [Aquisalinus sp.]
MTQSHKLIKSNDKVEAAWQVEAMEYEVYVGTSSAEQDLLQASFVVPVENVMRVQ